MSKKAWQIELETMQNSIPVVLKQEEQGWNYAETLEMVEDAAVAMKRHSNVPGSHAEEHVIIGGMQDMANMGYDVSAAEAMIEQGQQYLREGNKSALAGHTARTWHVMMNFPKIPDHSYWKHTIYESFDQYAAAVTFPTYEYDMEGEDFLRRTHLAGRVRSWPAPSALLWRGMSPRTSARSSAKSTITPAPPTPSTTTSPTSWR